MQRVLQKEVQNINSVSPGAENEVSTDTLINTMILKRAPDWNMLIDLVVLGVSCPLTKNSLQNFVCVKKIVARDQFHRAECIKLSPTTSLIPWLRSTSIKAYNFLMKFQLRSFI